VIEKQSPKNPGKDFPALGLRKRLALSASRKKQSGLLFGFGFRKRAEGDERKKDCH